MRPKVKLDRKRKEQQGDQCNQPIMLEHLSVATKEKKKKRKKFHKI